MTQFQDQILSYPENNVEIILPLLPTLSLCAPEGNASGTDGKRTERVLLKEI